MSVEYLYQRDAADLGQQLNVSGAGRTRTTASSSLLDNTSTPLYRQWQRVVLRSFRLVPSSNWRHYDAKRAPLTQRRFRRYSGSICDTLTFSVHILTVRPTYTAAQCRSWCFVTPTYPPSCLVSIIFAQRDSHSLRTVLFIVSARTRAGRHYTAAAEMLPDHCATSVTPSRGGFKRGHCSGRWMRPLHSRARTCSTCTRSLQSAISLRRSHKGSSSLRRAPRGPVSDRKLCRSRKRCWPVTAYCWSSGVQSTIRRTALHAWIFYLIGRPTFYNPCVSKKDPQHYRLKSKDCQTIIYDTNTPE